jgi:hypothetical protein
MNPVPLNFLPLKSMFIYQPHINSSDRVLWHGGESTQLHYKIRDKSGCWYEMGVRTLGSGLPSSMSEMHAELVEYYNHCQTAILDN